MSSIKLDYKEVFKTWEPPLKELLASKYMEKLINITQQNYKSQCIRPAKKDIFRAYKLTPFDEVKVVIIGQDPYPNKRASGLAFGNEEEFSMFKVSPSLEKIQQCIEKTIYDGFDLKFDPSLVSWGQQGVLLLNSALTVIDGEPNSHTPRWHKFIRETITAIDSAKTGVFFLFLGAPAKRFETYVSKTKNYAFTYEHPAFASRNNRDWNCPYFKEINDIIEKQNGKEYCIKW